MQSGNIYEGLLSFRGVWREYQARILREADLYLEDKRIHIVAAPGAGKTTLGIELIRRSGRPCLILSPRIIIRQQWLERIYESFISPGKRMEAEKYFSADIRCPGLITSATYQTLFCGMTGKKETEEGEKEDGKEKEEADISGDQLIHRLKEAGIGTICLDECPHQDYVWFNYPSEEEDRQVRRFREDADEMFQTLMEDRQLYEAAASHKALFRYEEFCDPMLENPEYLSGLLIYCQTRGIPFSGQWLQVLGVKELPEMNEKWMGYFLQGILFDSSGSCPVPEEFRSALKKELKARGLIKQNKVSFLVNDKLEKMLINSRGKLDSILQIAACEHASLGKSKNVDSDRLYPAGVQKRNWKSRQRTSLDRGPFNI